MGKYTSVLLLTPAVTGITRHCTILTTAVQKYGARDSLKTTLYITLHITVFIFVACMLLAFHCLLDAFTAQPISFLIKVMLDRENSLYKRKALAPFLLK